jgi:hypothetical protein
MGARIRSILATIAGCLAFGLIVAAAGSAVAGGCNCVPPPCCVPPTPPPPPSFACCQPPGHTVNIPGVNVFVASTVLVNANVNAEVQANANVNANANTFANGNTAILVGGGGGGGGFVTSGPQSLLQNLNVEGERRASFEATRTKIKKVVIEAVCIDDKAVPHPASQVSPDRDIEDSFDGELFRCIAGTHLQATIAEYLGHVSFDHGQNLDCLKNQALYHFPGGKVECRAQRPARDCNERSLLRRFGAGVKILTMITVEKYTETREETAQSSSGGSMILDGGVGGVMY